VLDATPRRVPHPFPREEDSLTFVRCEPRRGIALDGKHEASSSLVKDCWTVSYVIDARSEPVRHADQFNQDLARICLHHLAAMDFTVISLTSSRQRSAC